MYYNLYVYESKRLSVSSILNDLTVISVSSAKILPLVVFVSVISWPSIGVTINTSAAAQLSGRGGTGAIWPGSMGNAIIYNRELSAAEVLQNYSAQRYRFGI